MQYVRRHRAREGEKEVKHDYTGDLTNTELKAAIDEYIRDAAVREILKDRLCDGLTFERLAEKHGYSPRHIKRIVYKASERLFARLS